jgi:hypothetical protein
MEGALASAGASAASAAAACTQTRTAAAESKGTLCTAIGARCATPARAFVPGAARVAGTTSTGALFARAA